MMLARKWDRIENTVTDFHYDIFKAIADNPEADGILDDIRDLRAYLLLVEDHMTETLGLITGEQVDEMVATCTCDDDDEGGPLTATEHLNDRVEPEEKVDGPTRAYPCPAAETLPIIHRGKFPPNCEAMRHEDGDIRCGKCGVEWPNGSRPEELCCQQ